MLKKVIVCWILSVCALVVAIHAAEDVVTLNRDPDDSGDSIRAETISALEWILKNAEESYTFRSEALKTIDSLGPSVIEAMLPVFAEIVREDPSRSMRKQVLSYLRDVDPETEISGEVFLGALNSEHRAERKIAERALSKKGEEATDGLTNLIADKDAGFFARIAAARVLQELTPGIREEINDNLSDLMEGLERRHMDQLLRDNAARGGIVVHVGSGAGEQAAGLAEGSNFLIQGLKSDQEEIGPARTMAVELGLSGRVTFEHWRGGRLPYANNLVNVLFWGKEAGEPDLPEITRVLVPAGTAYVKSENGWERFAKPWPDDIDEWTHYLHSPDNNAVSNDEVVGPPRRLQWVNPPLWSRSHEHLASLSAAVSADGRLFYIMDKAPEADVTLEPQWTLHARDAFNGVPLWERSIDPWEWHKRGFRSGPPELPRRLVAEGNRVYTTLGYGAPVSALDAATGETEHKYEQTENTQEILLSDGVLYLVLGQDKPDSAQAQAERRARSDVSGWRFFTVYEELRPKTELAAVDVESGETLWRKAGVDMEQLMPATLAVAEGRVFFQNSGYVIALDAGNGDVIWRAERPVNRRRPSWSTPTLVVSDGVVLSADRSAPDGLPGEGVPSVEWRVSSAHTPHPPRGELIAFSAENGERLWSTPCQEGYNSAVDVLVADGLVWSGSLAHRSHPGIVEGRDLHTGEVKRTRPDDGEFYDLIMSHERCHRSKSTERYLITSRAGVEFADVKTGEAIANHWVRGECQYGVLPANGLLYAPPDPCACFIMAKLNSFHALAPGEPVDLQEAEAMDDRLERGPAFGDVNPQNDVSGDWPTYRSDPARSGSTEEAVSFENLDVDWETQLDAPITPPVAANGRVYAASTDTHTLHVLNANSGERLWRFTAGGRIDSPPTIWNGRVFFGTAGGWVYCLRSGDGELMWRYRAAPKGRNILAHGQLESAWPVHGSVLVLPTEDQPEEGAVLYAAAGRSGYLDGGIVMVRLKAESGEELSRTLVHSRDPETTHQPHPLPRPSVPGFNMDGALNDVLSVQGGSVFMRHLRFGLDGSPKDETKPHLHSPAGFLDDSWWHRTYWIVASQMHSGWGRWTNIGNLAPSGRLLSIADEPLEEATVYGFGRDRYPVTGAHPGLEGDPGANYRLFAQDMSIDPRRNAVDKVYLWELETELLGRSMVLTDTTLFVAGPRSFDSADDPIAEWEGEAGGLLLAISRENGEVQAEYSLDYAPVFDGMIALPDQLLFSTTRGRIISLTP